uniref:PH domain-containing protein n=1 Tax=Globisporangium ultimum (strain ATCC 200006 / CBS 805.95 / DAOM BR144) TaxID=431595 RepID=K3X9G6_GLOUD
MIRWKQSARCDYCNFAGGDLECATCDVIAHARCYLAAYESTVKKTKGAFVVPTRFSWLCFHCQQSLQEEYDERSKNARMQHIAMQRSIFGKVVTAYVRMTKDALIFQAKKKAIIKIQSAIRGRLARWRFDRLQRMCLKPYAIDSIKARGFNSEGIEITAASEDLRLSNGFTCNPFVYVSVVDGKDDENQLFCFETTLRKGVSLLDTEIAWNDKLFVPGVDGNITFCFTLLSKNGPNNFFLGQAILRLRDSDVIWRNGITTELALIDEVEIFPKNTQHQLLRLVEVGGLQVNTDRGSQKKKKKCNETTSGLFANGSSFALTLSVHVKPFSEVHSYCGYMGMKNTLDSFQTSSRWCVLADGILRIYRHFGVTLASDTVDMARTIDIRLVEAHKITNNGVLHRDQNCIAIQHMNRLYLLHCDQQSQNRVWLKKLIAATKFGTITASAPSPQQLQTIASTIGILSNNNTSESNGG